MRKVYEDKIKFETPRVEYGVNSGYRKLSTKNFVYCRDRFAVSFTDPKILYKCQRGSKIIDVARFIRAIETKLDIEPSKFYRTQRNNVLHIVVSPFWMKHKIRKSLFTLLLRIGQEHAGNYVQTIRDTTFASSNVIKSILKFLDGNTRFTGKGCNKYCGWIYFFSNGPSCLDLLQPEK